ncbi:uncharacterized protein LOC113483394 [Athene cunicularia]|uniref:uncharacterized protein LOC113483394 n=1 Tax=Athene cunicularia TaxID=194338 RepID=UPI000EF7049F|nr:uncharacterized protein LOC113483394 [Athene cunicularia]
MGLAAAPCPAPRSLWMQLSRFPGGAELRGSLQCITGWGSLPDYTSRRAPLPACWVLGAAEASQPGCREQVFFPLAWVRQALAKEDCARMGTRGRGHVLALPSDTDLPELLQPVGEGEKTGWTTCPGVFATYFVPVAPTTTCPQASAKGNGRFGNCPEMNHAAPRFVSGAAFFWVLPEPPAHGDSQSQSHAYSLCQMVLQMWSSPDQASAPLMSPSSSLPWHDALEYAGSPLCAPQLLSQPSDLHGLHVPARCHHCAAIATPSWIPSPSFFTPSTLETLVLGRQLFSTLLPHSPGGWHLLTLGWGEEWGRVRQEQEIRARDKAGPIFILQSNYQSFPILNLPSTPV